MSAVKLRRGLLLCVPEWLIAEIVAWWSVQDDRDSFMSASSVVTCWRVATGR